MEYLQTVLVRIEAAKIDEALRPQGLLEELKEHRGFLEQQPGFQDLSLARSINRDGNILLVVETRWQDDDSLVHYETHEPNVMGIMNKHQGLVIPDSLQVLDMEALTPERSAARVRAATDRLALPLLLPLGTLAFILLVVYGLSRVYLELPGDIATGLAAAIALGILAMAWFLSTRPVISGMQVGFIAVVAAGVLAGGAIYAVVDEDGGAEGEGETGVSEPTPGAGGVTGGSLVTMGDNFFEFEGERKPVIEVAAGEVVTWELTNNGLSVHNLHIAGIDNEYGIRFCNGAGEEPCSDPNVFPAGQSGTIRFQFDEPGTFIFRCDFHPQDMTGQVKVR